MQKDGFFRISKNKINSTQHPSHECVLILRFCHFKVALVWLGALATPRFTDSWSFRMLGLTLQPGSGHGDSTISYRVAVHFYDHDDAEETIFPKSRVVTLAEGEKSEMAFPFALFHSHFLPFASFFFLSFWADLGCEQTGKHFPLLEGCLPSVNFGTPPQKLGFFLKFVCAAKTRRFFVSFPGCFCFGVL